MSVTAPERSTDKIHPWMWCIAGCLLFAFLVGSRAKYFCHYLYSWDSVQFALSLQRFDVSLHQPHPPGYILYSFSVRLIDYFLREPNLSLIAFNAAATAAGAVFLIRFTFTLTAGLSTRVRFWASTGAALLYLSNPISWFSSSVAEIYPVEGFFVCWIAYLFIRLDGSRGRLHVLSIAFALAGGFRQSTELLLLPLYGFALQKHTRDSIRSTLVVFLIANGAWFFPMVGLSGGATVYLRMLAEQLATSAGSSTVMTDRTLGGVLFLRILQAVTPPISLALAMRFNRIRFWPAERYLLWTMVAPILFLVFIHFPRDGYLMIVIPFLIGLSVVALARTYSLGAMIVIMMLGFTMNYKAFVHPEFPYNEGILARAVAAFHMPNKKSIRAHEQMMRALIDFVSSFPAKRKVIVCAPGAIPDWRLTSYYFPEWKVYNLMKDRRVYVSLERLSHRVQEPVPLGLTDALFVCVGCETAAYNMRTTVIQGRPYYYSTLAQMPTYFTLSSIKFCRGRKGEINATSTQGRVLRQIGSSSCDSRFVF